MVEHVEQQARALGQGAELGLETDQAARRDFIVQPHAPAAVRLHVLQLALAHAQAIHHAALVHFLDVHHQLLDRLHLLAVDFLDDDFRARHGQLVAFAAHVLDQHRQVQLAAAGDQELVGVGAFLDLQRHVVQRLALEPLADLARGDELAAALVLVAGERRIVDLEGHADGRLVDGQRLQRLGRVELAHRVGNAEAFHAGNRDDVAGFGLGHLAPLQAHEAEHLQHFAGALLAVAIHHRNLLVGLDLAALDAADADQADVAVVVELADAHLERAVRIDFRRLHVLHDRFVQRRHVAFARGAFKAGVAVQGGGVDHRKVELLVGRAEAVEQVEGLVQHPVGAGAGAVDLVDHHDRLEAHVERLLRHEAGLRHRAVHRVDQDQHRIDHRQHALDLATEVGMARGVDDVDAVAVPGDRGVLGQDGDAALLLLVVGVHHALGQHGAFGERAGLLEQAIDERGLAVIDVGDDGDIAQFFDGHGIDSGGAQAVAQVS